MLDDGESTPLSMSLLFLTHWGWCRENGAHTISYDDGDVRLYDMKTRDYQVISAATAEAQSAGGKTVRWHL